MGDAIICIRIEGHLWVQVSAEGIGQSPLWLMRGHGSWRIAWWLSEVKMPQLVNFLTRKSHFFPSPHEIAISILDTNRDTCFLGRAGVLENLLT